MDINLDAFESFVKILVIGVGGGGSNAVNEMVSDETNMLNKIDFWVFNTDAQALANSKSPNRLVLGDEYTKGLGAGGNPEVGQKAAEVSSDRIKEIVSNYDMIFIACGEGGGTGTGAAPVVAKLAKEAGALTVAIVTRPFNFEGPSRLKKATEGILKLKEQVDSLIIISNDRLMYMNKDQSLKKAFSESDKVLSQSVRTITDLILLPGIINLDFADVRNTLAGKGMALIGFGVANGKNKAEEAAQNALSCPLLEASVQGAKTAIINITGGEDVTLGDASNAVEYIKKIAGNEINIIFGVQNNPALGDNMLVSIIATDFPENTNNTVIPDNNFSVSRTVPSKKEDVQDEIKDEKNDFADTNSILPDFFSKFRKENEKKKESESSSIVNDPNEQINKQENISIDQQVEENQMDQKNVENEYLNENNENVNNLDNQDSTNSADEQNQDYNEHQQENNDFNHKDENN